MPEVYGVFEGGGVRGTALVGAVAAAEESGVTFRAVAGTSAGAIVASLVAAGYDAGEMRILLTDKNFKEFKDPLSRVPGIRWIKAWRSLGFYKGEAFRQWIGEKISLKLTGLRHRSPSFQDLRLPLTVIAADVVRQQVMVFNERRTPDVPVADAVRMSMSIPFFFCPVRFGNSLAVDGGILSNFPAWVFDEEQQSYPLPVVGFRLEPEDIPQKSNLSPLGFINSLIDTVVRAAPELQNTRLPNLYMVDLPTLGIQTTHFDINDTEKDQLYQIGYKTAQAYFATTQLTLQSEEQDEEADL
jgi:NTE family protein